MKSVLFLLLSLVAITCTLASVGNASPVECRVSESLTNTTFKVNLTEEEREQVLIEGRCFLGCALERYGEQFETVSYSLSEYWPYINYTGVECSTSGKVHECTRGCIRALRYYEFHSDCIRICDDGCNMECEPFTAHCHPWIHMGCPITCDPNYLFYGDHPCRLGCRLEEHLYYESRDGNLPLDPVGPPLLFPRQNSTKPGHFFIDLRSAAPKPKEGIIVNRTLISPVTFLLRLEKVNSTDVFFNWTVNPFVEIDLSSYACQDLLVSFAVSNQAGLSNFSVPVQIAVHGAHLDAQLTSPGEAVREGKQVVFVCQQPNITLRWTVGNLPGGTNNELSNSASFSQAGMVLTFQNDPGFGFEIYILASSSASSVISELRVTAVRQLNDVTVECSGDNGSFMSTIQIASIVLDCGVPFHASGVIIHPFNNTKFGALITFHCDENDDSMTAVCGSDGEWIPNPASLACGKSGNTSPGSENTSTHFTSQLIITAIVCSLVCLVFGAFIGALIVLLACLRYVQNIKESYDLTYSTLAPPTSAQVIYEEVSPDSYTERKNDIELSENLAYGPVATV